MSVITQSKYLRVGDNINNIINTAEMKRRRLQTRKLSRNPSYQYKIYDDHGNLQYMLFNHVSFHGHSYAEAYIRNGNSTFHTRYQIGELPSAYELIADTKLLDSLRRRVN